MPQVTLKDDIYNRAVEFKHVIEAVISQELDFNDCLSLILSQGIDSMLADILGNTDQATMLASFQQLGAQHPAQVYKFVAATLRRGEAINERERLTRKLGFQPPSR
jgi:hypothetical protein